MAKQQLQQEHKKQYKGLCPVCGLPGSGPHWRYTKLQDREYAYFQHPEEITRIYFPYQKNGKPRKIMWHYLNKERLQELYDGIAEGHYLTLDDMNGKGLDNGNGSGEKQALSNSEQKSRRETET